MTFGSKTSTLTSYADDIKLFATTQLALSSLFEGVSHYLACFGMTVEPSKSNVLAIGGSPG